MLTILKALTIGLLGAIISFMAVMLWDEFRWHRIDRRFLRDNGRADEIPPYGWKKAAIDAALIAGPLYALLVLALGLPA